MVVPGQTGECHAERHLEHHWESPGFSPPHTSLEGRQSSASWRKEAFYAWGLAFLHTTEAKPNIVPTSRVERASGGEHAESRLACKGPAVIAPSLPACAASLRGIDAQGGFVRGTACLSGVSQQALPKLASTSPCPFPGWRESCVPCGCCFASCIVSGSRDVILERLLERRHKRPSSIVLVRTSEWLVRTTSSCPWMLVT